MDIFKMLEERYISAEAICGSLMEGIIIAASNSSFLYWNGPARYMLGNKQKDVAPDEWAREYGLYDLKGERYLHREEIPLVRALKGEEFHDYRFLTKNMNFPDGIVLSANGKPLKSGEATVGAVITFKDDSKQVELERDLENQMALYQSTLDHMPGHVLVKDLNSRYIYANKKALEALGVDSVLGMSAIDFFGHEMLVMIQEHDREIFRTGEARTFEEVIYTKDNQRALVLTTRFPYVGRDNEIRGICVVINDISSYVGLRGESVKEFLLSKAAIVGMLGFEVSRRVVGSLPHIQELNTSIVKDLKKEEVNLTSLVEKINEVERTIQQIRTAAETLNEFEHFIPSRFREKMTLKNVLDVVESLVKVRAMRSKVKWDMSGLKDTSTEFLANKIELSEIVLNMVVLALRAAEQCGKREITFYSENFQNSLRLTIVHSCPAKKTEGIVTPEGLSWSICKSISKDQGWQMDYKTIDNEGHVILDIPNVTDSPFPSKSDRPYDESRPPLR
jgi:PAS domain S-box-containing protein